MLKLKDIIKLIKTGQILTAEEISILLNKMADRVIEPEIDEDGCILLPDSEYDEED